MCILNVRLGHIMILLLAIANYVILIANIVMDLQAHNAFNVLPALFTTELSVLVVILPVQSAMELRALNVTTARGLYICLKVLVFHALLLLSNRSNISALAFILASLMNTFIRMARVIRHVIPDSQLPYNMTRISATIPAQAVIFYITMVIA
jgi:hypothetical protein